MGSLLILAILIYGPIPTQCGAFAAIRLQYAVLLTTDNLTGPGSGGKGLAGPIGGLMGAIPGVLIGAIFGKIHSKDIRYDLSQLEGEQKYKRVQEIVEKHRAKPNTV